MVALVKLRDADLQAIAEEVFGPLLGDAGFSGIVASAGRDHDGEPAVFVRVDMPSGSAIIPPRPLGDARVALWRALERHGDDRLAYVSVNWPQDEAPPSPDVPT